MAEEKAIPRNTVDGTTRNGLVVDPTKNVLDLVEAAVKRLNDLRDEADKRYEQRFLAQERATEQALSAVEKATASALVSAEKAVTKSEMAAEKRFEGLNELRNVVQDVLSKAMTRSEAEQGIAAAREKLSDAVSVWDTRHLELMERVNNNDTKITALRSDTMSRPEADARTANAVAMHTDLANRIVELDKRISVAKGEATSVVESKATLRANIATTIAVVGFIVTVFLWFSRIIPTIQAQQIQAPTTPAPQIIYVQPPVSQPQQAPETGAPIVVGTAPKK